MKSKTEQSSLQHFHWKCAEVHNCLHYHLTEVFLCVSSLHTTHFTQSYKSEPDFKHSGNREVHSLQRFIFHRRARLGKTKYCRILHRSTGILETMNFQLFFLDNANLQKELANVLPLVTLKLDNFTVFRMFNHSTITSKFLFEGFHKFLLVIVICNSLNSC